MEMFKLILKDEENGDEDEKDLSERLGKMKIEEQNNNYSIEEIKKLVRDIKEELDSLPLGPHSYTSIE